MGNKPAFQIPETMSAATIADAKAEIAISQVPVPRPRRGQVLIKVICSPINPSDVAHTKGRYAHSATFPNFLGFEASGTVVASGGGVTANYFVGKRVSFYSQNPGTWAEYIVVSAQNVFEADAGQSNEDAACSMVNPMTILMFLDIVLKKKARAVIMTAGASALSRMFARLLDQFNITVITIVRRKEQENLLRRQNPNYYILNQTEPDFLEKLKALSKLHNAKVCFDAVGGELLADIAPQLPAKSSIYVYGVLSGKKAEIDCGSLLFNATTITGFHAKHYLSQMSYCSQLMLYIRFKRYRRMGIFNNDFSRKFKLDEVKEAIDYYKGHMTDGKVLILPN